MDVSFFSSKFTLMWLCHFNLWEQRILEMPGKEGRMLMHWFIWVSDIRNCTSVLQITKKKVNTKSFHSFITTFGQPPNRRYPASSSLSKVEEHVLAMWTGVRLLTVKTFMHWLHPRYSLEASHVFMPLVFTLIPKSQSYFLHFLNEETEHRNIK